MEDTRQLVRDIRTRIEAIDLPREKIAPLLGVTYSWLCKFMQGKDHSPRLNTIQKVLDGLGRIERKPPRAPRSELRA